ncbi:flavin-binding monooxygenase-like protein-like protein [Lepidopterella palustris CBS 459.81]|uniref:Flavin-binding monooxygenase-like protein-like protein n=1 Tax=Lepidopterella palustris CBS 459.81 TaxID=1314670 RepID=A0A8E2EAG2_9PEZI|nr:flavin-binding monooxygenase-like protein-like protein [Lepidopterella palustris CBS 459.81]
MAAGDRHEVDLIVIGSGIYGIQAARTYLEIHPNHRIVILEADSCPGGVWSAERMYDAFWTQTPLQVTEFSDQPLTSVSWNDSYHGYFPAKHVTTYLNEYLENHIYNGSSLTDRIVFNARVQRFQKEDGKWTAIVQNSGSVYSAPKVIDASGHTSIPNIPQLPGAETFKGRTLHHKQFGRSGIIHHCNLSYLVVIGSAKSAADVVYSGITAGMIVTWIIQKSGSGPGAYTPATAPIKLYRNSNESFHTRFMGSLCASVFAERSYWSRFIDGTFFGNWILKRVWNAMQKGGDKIANFDRADGKDNGFHNLKPDTPLFWQNDSTGALQREHFLDALRHATVYRQDIECLKEREVILADGTSVKADVIVYATGWKHSSPYLDDSTAAELGLAAPISAEDPQEAAKWQELEQEADVQVLKQFRMLTHPPQYYRHDCNETPFRLYKSVIPVHDHSIAFLGKVMLGNNFYNAEVQALYAVAALDGNISLPPAADMKREIAGVVAWCRRRYLTMGETGNWFYWDVVPYTDGLLKQLGLSSHRKKGWRDLLKPALAPDLRGLIEEYKSTTRDNPAKNI